MEETKQAGRLQRSGGSGKERARASGEHALRGAETCTADLLQLLGRQALRLVNVSLGVADTQHHRPLIQQLLDAVPGHVAGGVEGGSKGSRRQQGMGGRQAERRAALGRRGRLALLCEGKQRAHETAAQAGQQSEPSLPPLPPHPLPLTTQRFPLISSPASASATMANRTRP